MKTLTCTDESFIIRPGTSESIWLWFHVDFKHLLKCFMFIHVKIFNCIEANGNFSRPMWDFNPLCLLHDAACNIFGTFNIPQFKTVTVVTLNSVVFSYKWLRILELESNEKNSRIQTQLQIFSMAADDVKPYFDVYLYIYNLLNL